MFRIAPSILSADVACSSDDVRAVAEAGADTFVAGSAIFGGQGDRSVIAAMPAELGAEQPPRAAV